MTAHESHFRDHLSTGQRVAAVATLLTVLMAVGKGVIGQLRGSPALTADAVHSFADTLAIFASWVGLKLAERPPSKRFPFGLYRAETLAALLVSAFLLMAGGHLLCESIQGLFGKTPDLGHNIDVLAAALASAGLSLGIYLWEKRAGTRLGSQSLLANADESRVDIMTSLAVFVGAGASYIGVQHVEMLVTVALSILILWLGVKHGRIALLSLLDADLDPEMAGRVGAIAEQTPGVMRVEEVRLRQAGLFWFGMARIQLRRSVDITRGHEIAHRVAESVCQSIPRIEALTVHLEPFAPRKMHVLVPVAENTMASPLSEHFGRAQFFALVTLDDARVANVEFIENPARQAQARAGLAAIKQLFEKNTADTVITREIGEIAFHALRDYYVEVHEAPKDTLKNVLDAFMRGAVPVLTAPTHASEAHAAPGRDQSE